jgi:hypothetical protein
LFLTFLAPPPKFVLQVSPKRQQFCLIACQAILYALTQLLYLQNAYEKVVILVDSKSVIQAISSKKTPKTQTVLEINKAL